MIKKITTIALALAIVVGASAQSSNEWSVRLGYNIGGTSPLPIPEEMESINTFNPGATSFGIEGDYERRFNQTWGLMAGIRIERKGMDAKVTVNNYHTSIEEDGSVTEGNFTGVQGTNVGFTLLTVPVVARLHLGDKWTVAAGPYMSYALTRKFEGEVSNGYLRTLELDPITNKMVPTGDRVEMTPDNPANYAFSNNLRSFQCGVEVGADYKCTDNILAFFHLDWGLTDIFKDSFKETISFPMYPIYGMVGVGYSF